MGNPSHPIGLRLAHYRKWATSWFTPNVATKTPSNLTSGAAVENTYEVNSRVASVVTSRGGNLHGGREERLTSLIRRVVRPLPALTSKLREKGTFDFKQNPKTRGQRGKGRGKNVTTTSASTADRVGVIRPIDLHVRVGAGGHISLFVYYVRQLENL